MNFSENGLTISPGCYDPGDLLSDWEWIFADGPLFPVMVTAMGDVFATCPKGCVYYIDVVAGTIEKECDNEDILQHLISDYEFIVNRLFSQRVSELQQAGMFLQQGEVYGYKKPLVLGGEDVLDNYEPTDVSVHISIHGQLHRKIKDLPDGTPIDSITFTD